MPGSVHSEARILLAAAPHGAPRRPTAPHGVPRHVFLGLFSAKIPLECAFLAISKAGITWATVPHSIAFLGSFSAKIPLEYAFLAISKGRVKADPWLVAWLIRALPGSRPPKPELHGLRRPTAPHGVSRRLAAFHGMSVWAYSQQQYH